MSNTLFSTNEEEISTPQQKPNFLSFFRTFRRKAWLIASVTALVTTAYVYIENKNNPPLEYAGSFQLLVEPLTFEAKLSEPSTLTEPRGIPNERMLAADYPTLLRILKSNDVLLDIVEKVQTQYPSFSIARLSKNLVVERIGESRVDFSKIVGVGFTDSDPQLVQLVLEETAQKYLNYALETRIQEITAGLNFIDQQLPQLNKEVAKNRNRLQNLQQEYQMVQADSKGESLLDTARNIQKQQMETQQNIEELTRVKNDLQSKLNLTVDEAIAISALRDNPSYKSLVQSFKEKEKELAVLSTRFNSRSPQIIALQEEKQQLSNLLNAEIRQTSVQQGLSGSSSRILLANNQDSILLSLVDQLVEVDNKLKALQARKQALTTNANIYEEQIQEFPLVSRQYKELQQELAIANVTREQLLIKKNKLQIQASQTQTPWQIVTQPKIITDSAGNPVPLPSDSQAKVILKGLMAGLILGMGIAILMEKNSDNLYCIDDLEDNTRSFPILAKIPFNPNLRPVRNQKLATNSWKNFPVASFEKIKPLDEHTYDFLNAFDKLYANISLRYRYKTIRSIAICSPTKGDGRSTIALHLAKQIAARGKKVLLVDANSFDYQLPDKLISAHKAEENLFTLIVSQKALENSVERENLMNEFKTNYDYVIYDTPPLLNSVTASFLSINTDGVLLITAINQTNKSLLKKSLEQVEDFKLPLLGIVANHTKSEKQKGKSDREWEDINQTQLFDSISNVNTLDAETSYPQKNSNISQTNKNSKI